MEVVAPSCALPSRSLVTLALVIMSMTTSTLCTPACTPALALVMRRNEGRDHPLASRHVATPRPARAPMKSPA